MKVRCRRFYKKLKASALKYLKNLYDQRNIKTQTNQLLNLQCKACPQSGNPCKQEGGRDNSLQYFNFGVQYPFQQSYQYYTLHL